MREFSFTLAKELAAGLRRSYRNTRNAPGLTTLFNAEVGESGLVQLEGITNPFSVGTLGGQGIEVNWPFPRLFRGNTVTLLADETRLFEVDESDWSLAELTAYGYGAVGTALSIPTGGSWQMLDAHDTWMLMNGSCVIFKSGLGGVSGRSEEIYINTDVHIETGCLYKGRGMLAGFDPEKFWSKDWLAFWDEHSTDSYDLGISRSMPFKDNFVWWSTIGGGDLFWMFYPELYMRGVTGHPDGHTPCDPYIFDLLQRNECGFAPMTYRGRVRVLLPLGEGVIAYGDGGLTYLQAVSEPVPTMARLHMSNIGIASGVAAAGDLNQHIYVDGNGCVWHIDANRNITRLGYEEHIQPMLSDDILVAYSPEKERFTISGSDLTFMLTKYGMSQIDQRVTSIVTADGTEVGLSTDLGFDNSQLQIVTDTFDMNNRAIKLIRSVEVHLNDTATWYMSVQYRMNKADAFKQTVWRQINKEGWAVMPCTGTEFRICLYCADYSVAEPPDNVVVKWQMSDKRNVRGGYAGATIAESGVE